MKKIIVCLICFVSLEVFSQQVEWTKKIQGGINTISFMPENNNIYISGVTLENEVVIDTQVYSWTGNNIGYIIELDLTGSFNDVFNLNGNFIPRSSFHTSDCHYLAGTSTGATSICLNKNELNGNNSWKHCYSSIPPAGQQSTYYPNNRAHSITQYQQSLFVTGIYQDSLNVNGSWLYGSRSFFGKFSSQTGYPIWIKNLPGNNGYGKMNLLSLNDGTFLLNTDIYYGGVYNFDSIGIHLNIGGTVIAKTDTDGGFIWAKAVSELTRVTDMAVDSEKNIYITGNYNDSCRIETSSFTGMNGGIFLAKMDSLGNIIWSKVINGELTWPSIHSNALGIDGNNSVFITGSFDSDTINLQDTVLVGGSQSRTAFLAKFSSSGNLMYAMSLPTTTTSSGYDLTVDNNGSVYWGGSFQGQLIIGNDTLHGNSFNQPTTSYLIKISNPEYITSGFSITKKTNIFNVFPNPGTGRITIDFEQSYDKGSCVCNIYNTLNEKVYTNKMQGSTPVIDLSVIPKGLYFVEVVAEGQKQVKKIVLN